MRRAELKNSCTKGVLDPRLRERTDLVHYYNALAKGTNIQVRPQGGWRRRSGSRALPTRRGRFRLEPVWFSGASVTAHNGGTTAHLVDGNPATVYTTSAVGNANFVVLEVDLGTATSICFVDVIGFSCAAGAFDKAIGVEYFDGSSWRPVAGADDETISPRRHLRATKRTRRFGEMPGNAIVSRYWRVVAYNAVGAGEISLDGLKLWRETNVLSASRLIPFAKSSADTAELLLTDRNIDVFSRGRYLASIPVDVPSEDVSLINVKQSLDTLFLFAADLTTPVIVRQGERHEWNIAAAAFTNVPDLSSSTSFSGSQNEQQEIVLPNWSAARSIVLMMGDKLTQPFTAATAGDLPAAFKTAIGSIHGMTSADNIVELAAANPVTVKIEFAGANGGRRWPKISALMLGHADIPVTTVKRQGLKADGKLMSEETGWPRTGIVHQGRLLLGGFRAAPSTFLGSMVDGLYDFTLPGTPALADRAVMYTLDTDQVETINEIFVGRHLHLFTDSSEWWIENRYIDASQPVNFIRATAAGIEPAVPVVLADGASLFVQKGGNTLREFLYDQAVENYAAEPLSLLGPHLIDGVVDMALRRATDVKEGNLIHLVNADGSLALLTLLKSQEVIALTPQVTAGRWRSVMVDMNREVWQVVERRGELRLELVDETAWFDETVTYEGPATNIMTGLDRHEGQQVEVRADGDHFGPFTVTGGQIELPVAAAMIEAGLPFYADVETLPLREKLQQGQPFRFPARVYEVELSLMETARVWVGANRQPVKEVPLRHLGGVVRAMLATGEEPANDVPGTPLADRLYSGQARRTGIQGWSKHPVIRITQLISAPLEVRAVRYEVAYG